MAMRWGNMLAKKPGPILFWRQEVQNFHNVFYVVVSRFML
jgi:hypothetical protein